MARLHIYTAHILPTLPHPYESAQFVEEGFSWKAFFFTFLWTLYHRLWWQTLAIIVASLAITECSLENIIGQHGTLILSLGINVITGFGANDWRRNKLTKQGYLTSDIVSGDSLLRAQQRFFEQYFSTRPMAA